MSLYARQLLSARCHIRIVAMIIQCSVKNIYFFIAQINHNHKSVLQYDLIKSCVVFAQALA
jgi:hypothetical protein